MITDNIAITMNIKALGERFEGMINVHAEEIKQSLQSAINEFCKPENLQKIIQNEVNNAIEKELQQRVKAFFSSRGEGQRYIDGQAKKLLKQAILEVM